jgi:hypothetical protein
MTIKRQEDVIELQISIDNALGVEILQRKQDFTGIELGLSKGELLLLDVKHEISSRNVLHDKVDSGLGLETRMQTKKERVSLLCRSLEYSLFGLRTGNQLSPINMHG